MSLALLPLLRPRTAQKGNTCLQGFLSESLSHKCCCFGGLRSVCFHTRPKVSSLTHHSIFSLLFSRLFCSLHCVNRLPERLSDRISEGKLHLDAKTASRETSDHKDMVNISSTTFKTFWRGKFALVAGTQWLIVLRCGYVGVDRHLHSSMSVRWNDMLAPCNEEEELKKFTMSRHPFVCQTVLNANVHVRSIVLYEYLRHSMTSHSGCWWSQSFHLPVN